MAPETTRIGDRDRAEAAERLSAHAAAGRLTVEELEERLDRAGRAVDASDLRALEVDLPAPPAPPAPWRPPVATVAVALACVAAAVLATVLAGHPIVPPFLLAAVLLWRAGARPRPLAWRRLP
jgi:hypothetical protein